MIMKKFLTFLLIISALIIFNLSLDTIYVTMSPELRTTAIQSLGIEYRDYLTMILTKYALNISIPMIFALYSIYEFKSNQLSKIYLFIWFFLNLAGAAYAFWGMYILKIFTVSLYLINALILLYLSMKKLE